MAQNTTVVLDPNAWTSITDATVTSITFQNQSFYTLHVKGTVGATPPSNFDGALEYAPGVGELNTALQDLWPGIVATHVYVYCTNTAKVMFSHA